MANQSNHSCPIELLENRLMLFHVGGNWENFDDLAFSYANIFDGGIKDASGNAVPVATIRSAILEGMSVWTGVVPVEIHQEVDSGPNPADLAYFNFDRLCRFGLHDIDGPGNIIGHAWGPNDLSSLAGDVHIDDSEAWGTQATPTTSDLIEVFTHEFGHALGMQHEDSVKCVMNSNQGGFFNGPGTAKLFADDINGIQSLYGKGLGYVLTDADRLIVSGTGSSDHITVDYDSASDDLVITSSGIGSFRIDEDKVLTVEVDGRDGDDTIDVVNLPSDTECVVNAGSGNDTINVGGGDLNTNINSDVTVNGDLGEDKLFIRDTDDDGGTYDITPSQISKPNSNLVSWTIGDLESLVVDGSNGSDAFNLSGSTSTNGSLDVELDGNDASDTFNLDAVDGQLDVSVNGGGGTDFINIGNGDFDSNIDGNVDVNGGDLGDIMTIDDKDDVGTDTYVLDSTSFSKDSSNTSGVVTFREVSTVEIDGSASDSTFNVLGTASGVLTTLNGRGGDDTFNIGDYDYDSNILGTLSIDGGGGTGDFMEIRDSSDGGPDRYTFADDPTSPDATTFTKTDADQMTTFQGVEEVHLLANEDSDDIFVGGTGLGTNLTVYGLGGNDDIYVGTTGAGIPGDLDQINGALTIWAGAGNNDDVIFSDNGDSAVGLGAADSYTVADNALTKHIFTPLLLSESFTYFESEEMTLEANSDSNGIDVESTLADTSVFLHGNGGNDTFRIGKDDKVGNIDGEVQAEGDSGSDSLEFNDGASTGNFAYTVSSLALNRDGTADIRPTVEDITVNGGSGDNVFTVSSNTADTTINGGDGDDTFNVSTGVWDGNVTGSVTVNGEGDSDSLVINDRNDTGADLYTVTSTQATKSSPNAGAISYGTIESFQLDANDDINTVTVNGTIDGDVVINTRGGNDTVDVRDCSPTTVVNVDGGAGIDTVKVNSDGVSTARVQFASDQDLNLLEIDAGGLARLNAGGLLLDLRFLTVQGRLNLTDGVLIDRSPTLESSYRTLLAAGYSGGAWNGAQPSIFSSVASGGSNTSDALGYGTAGEVGVTSFHGSAVNSGDLLVSYTLYGDANLDGKVDTLDFNALAGNFGGTNKGWYQADFNYDGLIDTLDFNSLAAQFGKQVV